MTGYARTRLKRGRQAKKCIASRENRRLDTLNEQRKSTKPQHPHAHRRQLDWGAPRCLLLGNMLAELAYATKMRSQARRRETPKNMHNFDGVRRLASLNLLEKRERERTF